MRRRKDNELGYYYGGYRRRRYRYSRGSGSGHKTSNQSKVSRLYGGIDDDVRRMFFALPPFTLTLVFNRYEKDYGEGKRTYAVNTFQQWRSGKVKMGGEISERLVRIVPPFLTFDQKYELIEKLWKKFRKPSSLSVTISPYGGIDGAIQVVMDAVEAIGAEEIPEAVAERLEWLASDDSVAAQSLLEEVTKREGQIAVQTLEQELRQLLAVAIQHSDKIVHSSRVVKLPSATIHITVSQSAPIPRRPSMGNEQEPSKQPTPSQLARTDTGQPVHDLSPIQNPNDLLGEALRRMPPKKQEEIIGKAAEEALRLQVKQSEGRLDHEMGARKVDSAAEAARRLEGHQFEVKADHKSEHGSVQVTVRNKPPTMTERVGKCFVATACYGDLSHPAVVILRRFRDTCLAGSEQGRDFIAWYYRNGSALASLIEDSAWKRLLGRVALWPLVVLAFIAVAVTEAIQRHRDAQMPR